MVHASRRELVGQLTRYSFHSFEMVISSGFRDSHRMVCITVTNLFDLTYFVLCLLFIFGIATGLAMGRLGDVISNGTRNGTGLLFIFEPYLR